MEVLELNDSEKAILSSIGHIKAIDEFLYNMAYFIPCAVVIVLGVIRDPSGPWVIFGILAYGIIHGWMMIRHTRFTKAYVSLVLKMKSQIEETANKRMKLT